MARPLHMCDAWPGAPRSCTSVPAMILSVDGCYGPNNMHVCLPYADVALCQLNDRPAKDDLQKGPSRILQCSSQPWTSHTLEQGTQTFQLMLRTT